MAGSNKVVINLMTGHEDADKVTVAFLVATAAQAAGKDVIMFLTKEAVRLGLPGYADAIESAGSPPVSKLSSQFADAGGRLFVSQIELQAATQIQVVQLDVRHRSRTRLIVVQT